MDYRKFVAIDFETDSAAPESACALAIVTASDRIVETWSTLLRPKRVTGRNTSIHGISAREMGKAPRFAEIWPEVKSRLEGAVFVVAHRAAFDLRVMDRMLRSVGGRLPAVPVLCSAELARRVLGMSDDRLRVVCERLGIENWSPHDPRSDAEACVQIVFEARRRLEAGTSSGRLPPAYAKVLG